MNLKTAILSTYLLEIPMRRVSIALLIFALLPALLAAAPGADEAKGIVEKGIKAQGGADKLAKLKAGRLNAKGKGDFPMIGEQEFTIEDTWQGPDHYKTVIEMTIGGQAVKITQTLNGKEGWIAVNDMVMDTPAKELAEFKEQAYAENLDRLGFIKEDGYKLDVLKEIKIDDKPAVGVVVSSKDHRDVKLYFDKDSGLLVKREHEVVDEGGNKVNQEVFFSDYKDKDGLKNAHKLLVHRSGKKFLEAEVTEIEFFDKKLDDDVFAKPGK
jgi:hypothetical protein